jgi:hypothetical protein
MAPPASPKGSATGGEPVLPAAHQAPGLGHIEVVAPGHDAAVGDVEGAHHGEKRLDLGRLQQIDPLGENGGPGRRQMHDLEGDPVEHHEKGDQRLEGGVDALGGLHGDVVVDDVLGQQGPQQLGVPGTHRRAEATDDVFGPVRDGHGGHLLAW